MPTADRFLDANSSLQDIAERYRRFNDDPERFLEHIHELDPKDLRGFADQPSEALTTITEGERQIRPVVFLRHSIVRRILDGDTVSPADIEEIRDRIDARDPEYFRSYPGLHDAIVHQKDQARARFTAGISSPSCTASSAEACFWLTFRLRLIALRRGSPRA